MMPSRCPARIGRLAAAVLLLALAACNPQELAERRGSRQRLSIATGGTGGVYYPYGGGIAKVLSEHVENVEATAEVTAASVDNLKFLRDGQSDVAFTMADTLADAVSQAGPFESFGAVPARALAVLYSNYTHVVTLESTGITRLADLQDRIVSIGSPGSGTEVIALRILRAAGLNPGSDLTMQNLGVAQSVDALKDGKIQAFFWSGGLPTAAILDLASTPGQRIAMIPTADVLPALQEEFGESLYYEVTIPQPAYPGLAQDVPTVAVANLLVVNESMPEDLAYRITQAIFEHRDELAAIHPQAKELTLETAVTGSPAPFHPGAIRYYREQNAWTP